MIAAVNRRMLADGGPRYTAYLRSTPPSRLGSGGYEWSVTDENTGLVVRSGWCAGPKRDAEAEARLAISELS